ncbi:MAG: ATP synthase F1 subunit delta [Sumerlaeia bacterium]
MKKEHLIAKVYAEALFAAAKSANAVKSIMEDAEQLFLAFEKQPRFLAFLEAPNVPTEDKFALAEKVLTSGVNRLLRNFVLLMLKKHRIELLRPALDHFETLAEADQGLTRGVISSATELSETEKSSIVASLERYMETKLTARFKVDSTLIGGITFKAGDLFIDNSIKTRLSNLRRQLHAAFSS